MVSNFTNGVQHALNIYTMIFAHDAYLKRFENFKLHPLDPLKTRGADRPTPRLLWAHRSMAEWEVQDSQWRLDQSLVGCCEGLILNVPELNSISSYFLS